MGRGTQVGELRELIRRRTAERLSREYGLEGTLAEYAADLVIVGIPEPAAVAEIRDVLARTGEAGVPGHVAELVAMRKAADA